MLTPPYHLSIVACPPYLPNDDPEKPQEILYRGSVPSVRNFPLLKRLHLRTILCLQKKPLGEGEPLVRWAKKHKVEILWIKAEKMTEESLGMGRSQVGDALKTILDTSAYPLYIADKDGISHTTLLVSCLRKLQGWTPESILDEITRFEPDHEDLPLVPFITSYLATGPSTDALVLPAHPLPSWLWPTTMQSSTGMSEKPAPTPVVSGIPTSRSASGLATQAREREPSSKETKEKEKEKEKERERNPSAPIIAGPLPFPNPLSSRKHPTMKLTFPTPSPSASMPPPPTPAVASSLRHTSMGGADILTSSPITTPIPSLSRVNSRRERSTTASTTREDDQSLMGAATSILSAALGTLGISGDEGRDGVREGVVGRKAEGSALSGSEYQGSRRASGVGQMSRSVSGDEGSAGGSAMNSQALQGEEEVMLSRRTTRDYGGGQSETIRDGRKGEGTIDLGAESGDSSAGLEEAVADEIGADETEEEEDEYEEDEEDEDEDDDDDTDLQPTSLHISALDLAGYS